MGIETIILIIAGLAGFYMAWNIGANDVANAMGTSVGSKALTLTGAVVVAAVFELGGATLVGGHVTETVRKGIVSPAVFPEHGFAVATLLALLLGSAALIAAETYNPFIYFRF